MVGVCQQVGQKKRRPKPLARHGHSAAQLSKESKESPLDKRVARMGIWKKIKRKIDLEA